MLQRVRTILLLGLALLFSPGVDAAAQVGRLFGTVAYATPIRPTPARGVRVFAVDAYTQTEARTDSDGNFVMVLRAGNYRVVAMGAPGYITAGEVWGYVRANTDSIITPNPLFLVPASSTGSMTSHTLSRMETPCERLRAERQNNFTLEATAQNGGRGKLCGRVVFGDNNKPAGGITVVLLDNKGEQHETPKTNNKGYFETNSWAGTYTVRVVEPSGYVQKQELICGNVRANTDSIITPNPIYLMPGPKSDEPRPLCHQGRQ